MKVPGKARWALVAVNTLIVVLSLPSPPSFPAPSSLRHIDMKSLSVPMEQAWANAKDVEACFGLPPRAGICAGRLRARFAMLRRPENVFHRFRAYPLPYPNENVESPLTYRI